MADLNYMAESGEKPIEAKSDVDLVREAREKLKQENDALEAEIARKEKLRAEASLASTAGIRPPVNPPKVETAKEYAERVMRNEVKTK